MTETSTSIVYGNQQSPVDICQSDTIYAPTLASALKIGYEKQIAKGTIEGDNFVIATPNRLKKLKFRGVDYDLKKIHFHQCCEHLIDSHRPADHELHFLHQRSGDGQTDKLVIALFFDSRRSAPERAAFKAWNAMLDLSATEASTETVSLKLADFLSADRSKWFTYEGSLTSYPFSQDVTWVVNRAAETIKASDIKKIKETEQHTRDPLPLHRRYVLRNFRTVARKGTR